MNSVRLTALALALTAPVFGQTYTEDFSSGSNPGSYTNPDGILFELTGIFSTVFNSYFQPQIEGRHSQSTCNGCSPSTFDASITFPTDMRTIQFGWGSQSLTTISLDFYRDDIYIETQSQAGATSSGLYKATFNRTLEAGFDYVDIYWSDPQGTGRGALLDNFVFGAIPFDPVFVDEFEAPL